MAIPGERLSTTPVPAPFRVPDIFVKTDMLDWERGGIAISDPSQGLDVRNWWCFYAAGVIFVATEAEAAVPVIAAPRLRTLSFTFDQNMRPVVAYMAGGSSFLYWYNSAVEGYELTQIPQAISPRLTLDDKRDMQVAASDVILAYTKANKNLYYRLQRERYETEHLLAEGVEGRLVNLGMNVVNRLQFELRQ